MKCPYYENFSTVNTFMKFILVVYMCLAGSCESVYEAKLYDTQQNCELAGLEVKQYAMQKWPESSGEIWCLTQDEFKKYQDHYDITDET